MNISSKKLEKTVFHNFLSFNSNVLKVPVSTSQIERRGSLARKTSEESSPTAIRMLKTAPIERMESTDVEESEEETVMMTTDEKENQKKPNENDDEVMVVDEEQFIGELLKFLNEKKMKHLDLIGCKKFSKRRRRNLTIFTIFH